MMPTEMCVLKPFSTIELRQTIVEKVARMVLEDDIKKVAHYDLRREVFFLALEIFIIIEQTNKKKVLNPSTLEIR